MALFQYESVNDKGKKISGLLDADNYLDAKQKLLSQSVFITRITAIASKREKPLLNRGDLLNFSRELSRLLKAGLPLYESLCALEEKYRGHKAQRVLLDLCQRVRGGSPLSIALGKHGKTFDFLYVAMISNAEKTGSLSQALSELGSLLEKQMKIQKQLVSALLYPSMLLGFCFFVVCVLLFYVVPSLEELFEGRSLHFFTEMVFSTSRFVREMKLGIGMVLVLMASISFGVATSKKWKTFLFARVVAMPWIGPLFAKVALIRFCRAASTLLDGGVPIVSTFAQARATMNHPVLETVVERAERAIAQGDPIHSAFKDEKRVPPLVPRMIGIAEQTGNLPGMLHQIADIYEEDIERALSHFSAVAQPALLILLGIIVGFVLLSVLLPLTDVSSFATN